MIARLGEEHALPVARLHCECLTGLLSDLGFRAAAAYYRGCARSPAALGLVCLDDQRLLGFALGSATPGQLRRDALRLNPWETLAGILAGTARRPRLAAHLLSSLKGPPTGSYDSQAAELTYLAVSPAARGRGLGRGLLDAFGQALSKERVLAYELSVDEDNRGAIRFYEKAGFKNVGEYREFGVARLRYRASLPSPLPAGLKTC